MVKLIRSAKGALLTIRAGAGDRIRHLRKSARLSQAELGRMVGLSGTQISKCETGANQVTVKLLSKLAVVFGVDASWLAGTPDPAAPGGPMTPAEADLLQAYRALSTIDMQIAVLRLLDSLANRPAAGIAANWPGRAFMPEDAKRKRFAHSGAGFAQESCPDRALF